MKKTMKRLTKTTLMVAILSLPVTAPNAAERHGMDGRQRFQEMDDMMDRAEQSAPLERHRLMREHMAMMMRHMNDMQGMGPMNGQGVMQDGRMTAMQERMEAMQQMLGQMLRQQEMMMEMMDEDD